MSHKSREWTLEGFVQHFDFVHKKMLDHKFVWMLGAGASRASGIPLGSELVDRWLSELHVRELLVREDGGKPALADWATAEQLGIPGFKYEDRASHYPRIYERRFRDYPDEGYAYLESVMADADPSPGYSILAAALAGAPSGPPRHNAVVTTNFDNLVADALSIYTDTFPFVCGHESLTPFVKVHMRRPLVCKIHRDLLLAPQNDPRSLRRLHDAWGAALRALFEHYTPLFIGYGGNDDTLMDLLESLQPGDIKGQLIWCYFEKSHPSERIKNLVTDLKGILVPVPDFDLLMVLLGEKMGIRLMDEEITRRASERVKRYRHRIQQLDTVAHPEVTKALEETFRRSGGWWVWEQKARREDDPNRREIVYRQGIAQWPQSAELHGNFAVFMTDVRRKHDEAEQIYRKAIELNSQNPINVCNFANFMTDVRRNHDEAERLYRKAMEIDPKYAINLGNYANFMTNVRGDHDEAETLYRMAIQLEPKNPDIIANFANLMTNVRDNHDEAERLYNSAFELDPKNAIAIGNLANLAVKVRRNYNEAERLYQKAIELDPNNATNAGNYAAFLSSVRGNHDEAERLYRKALEIAPANITNLCNYAAFMTSVRGNHDEAESLFRKAIELEPRHSINTGKFAAFLTKVRRNHDEAEQFFREALELDPRSATNAANFAIFMMDVRGNCDEAERLYRQSLELDPKNAANTVNFAIFMVNVRGNYDEAERLYRQSLELDSENAATFGSYASFMTNVRGDHVEAERLYRKALELAPESANNTGNYAAFLLSKGKLDESATMLTRARMLSGGKTDQLAAEIALHTAILASARGQDNAEQLTELQDLLTRGFSRASWSFDRVLAYAKEVISLNDYRLYVAIAEAILDATKAPTALALLVQHASKAEKPHRRKAGRKNARK